MPMMGAEKKRDWKKDEEENEGKCVLVGLEMDGNGRDLISWTLSKVAKCGDRVVVVHVCPDSDLSNNSPLSLIQVLDEYLAVYEGLCNLKQVVLVGRVLRGNSIQRVLVREAKLNIAMTVVVGANKTCSYGNSASVAKYCAKKLPPTTALFAVQNGRVILERPAAKLPQCEEPKPNLRSILHPNVGMDPKVIIPSTEKEKVSCENNEMSKINSSSTVDRVRNLPEPRPGWPLLWKAVFANLDSPKDTKARKMSVVQWVMNLPNRSFPAIEYPKDAEGDSSHHSGENRSLSVDVRKELEILLEMNPCSCKWFSFEELRSSTSNFSSDNLIGKGGNSRVYKGSVCNDKQVAIKVSKLSAKTSKDFRLEVEIITSLRHERIVPLIGICMKENRLVSVYSYFSKGSLEEVLHGKRNKPPLTWETRYKVAIGVAEALSYLHYDCHRPVIHRDVKSSNILLTDKFEPLLSDFGLAVWVPNTTSFPTHNDVVGTFGYLAPEYFMYGKVSDKIDVYAFGVVLLELLTGRKPINDDNPKGQESLVMWAKPILERGEQISILDPNIDGKYEEDQLRRMLLAATLCISRTASSRPRIGQILSLLRGDEVVETWRNANVKSNENELDCQEEEACLNSSFGSHIGLALLDVDDDASVASYEQSNLGSWEAYLKGRWSRSSSFE